MASPLLLITGATGFVGFKVLLDALGAGYTVRAAVRYRSGSKLSFSTIDTLLHQSTRYRVSNLYGPFAEVYSAYRAFKVDTLNATDDFVKQNKPSFDFINIFSGFIYGQNEMATDVMALLSGSNRLLLLMLRDQSFPLPRLAGAAHIDDVAKVHLLALDEKFRGKPDFGVTVLVMYNEAFNIVKKNFPQSVQDGAFAQGHQPSMAVHWDASRTEEVLGLKFKGFENMVVDLARQFLELIEGVKA